MRRWTQPLPAEPDRAILSNVWTTSTCYKPLEIERHTIDAHSAPPHSRPRLLNSGLRVVRQTLASAPHALAGPQEGIVAAGRWIVQRYASARGTRWRPHRTRAGGASRPPAAAGIGARTR